MDLSQPAKDLLWSESGGHCQNPKCRVDLHGFVKRKHVGELAHIIPASRQGPRRDEGQDLTDKERAAPENVVLLCPTCHKVVDKGAEDYPADVLRKWKRRSQKARALAHGTPEFSDRSQARERVERILGANHAVYDRYGPLDDSFDDARADQWQRHLRDTVIPNNRELLLILQANRRLLTPAERKTADVFAVHVTELEERHLEGDWTPGSTRFPAEMDSILDDDR
ncbi:HNH endonuclease signature motif containing protein [Mycobacterium asiaticum]|uniref:HNH endonuclease signature motif containing protein n=1 Tax=Mycobacterium asiaticum TaxID=1790 RepID=UPI001C12CAED|nr:HNH endonuclease signature motif containing protein [Mycobacterium asiaticum]